MRLGHVEHRDLTIVMSKRVVHSLPKLGKKPRMSSSADMELDEALHSRQIAVYGRESMRKLAAASVAVVGAGALGVEVAKNVVLAGVKSLTIIDGDDVQVKDLSAQFYLTQDDVGKNKAVACVERLQELNPAVRVAASNEAPSQGVLSQYNVVVCCNGSLEDAMKMDAVCHEMSIPFIFGEIRGLFASVFTDFGPAFVVHDTDGLEPLSGIVTYIQSGNPTLVTCVDDQRLEFEDGMFVKFSEVEGMDELNTMGPISVGRCATHEFQLDLDTTDFKPYKTGGIVTQVKQPKTLKFKPLKEALNDPGEFLQCDFSKLDRPGMLHVAFQALDAFRSQHHRMPKPGSALDVDALFELAEAINKAAKEPIELDRDILKHFASGAASELNPMAAMFGGILGQEVVKAASGKFHPLYQFFYFDSLECLPDEPLSEEEIRPIGSRYDDQIAIIGKSLQKQLEDLNVFLVGAGALGCEFMKNFAMMGISCGENGRCTVTDDDVIEKSNLSRQFLFRDWNIGSSKSTVAAEAAIKLNPSVHMVAMQDRVNDKTEEVFHDEFWKGLDLVVNALDNVAARLYVDAKCVYFGKPLLESGTLGTKCNTQDVVPFVTENYGASQDPPEKEAPMCTLHSFPHNIDHCLAWARSEFEGMFEKTSKEANNFLLENSETYKVKLKKQMDASAREQLENVFQSLTTNRCQDFESCIRGARLKFASYFHDKIAQLVYTFPEDNVTSNGTRFWSPPKRFPTALEFDPKDDAHCSFVQATAILFGEVYGVQRPEWAADAKKVGAVAADIIVPEFVPKAGVYIETDPDAQSTRQMVPDDGDEVERLWEQLRKVKDALPQGFSLHPIQFEKDDDTNYHMDVIAGLANLRARNYGIGEVDKLKAKLIAGRIIPAIATTTAMATGLACLELLKVIQNKKIEAYRNTFANLALPLFAMAEPIPAKEYAYQDLRWTLWDRWEMKGDLTVQDLIDYFDERKLQCYSISAGASLLFNSMFPKHEERRPVKLSKLMKTVAKIDISDRRKHFDVVVACEDENGEDYDVPLVSIYFR